MTGLLRSLCLAAMLSACLPLPRAAAQSGFPFTSESLNYSVNWPSGLSLGEAHLSARKSADRWQFEFTLEAAIPGFSVRDHYTSSAGGNLCSLEFEKDAMHGTRKTREKTTFDYQKRSAQRTTLNGGDTNVPISDCARDALDFLFYARRELGQGRVPAPQTVFFGASYEVRLEYSGAQTIPVNDVKKEADRMAVAFKGPSSDFTFEIFFARDAARTPLLVRVPFALGTFSMELIR